MRRIGIFAVVFGLGVLPAAVQAAQAGLADDLGYYVQGGTLSSTADYSWWYGCSPTSAGMMIGYYDRNGYGGLGYSNLVQGGVAEPSAYAGGSPLANAAIASARHISDFYRNGYNATGDDLAGAPTGPMNCLADYMGTSQDACGNVNGGTTFWDYTDGSRLYAKDIYNSGPSYYNTDGMFGVYEYIKNYAGYDLGAPQSTMQLFSQYIYGYNGNTTGFTWNNYKAEIDAGRPMLIQVSGHTMIGYGYNDGGTPSTEQIILNDTWTAGPHTMTWGGSYSDLQQYGVMGLQLEGGSPSPEPSTFVLLLLAAAIAPMIAYVRRRRPSDAK
jgi:hypothetical protein